MFTMNAYIEKGKQVLIEERDKVITQAKPSKRKDDPVDGIIRATASLVGFVSEAHQHRQKKAQTATQVQERYGGETGQSFTVDSTHLKYEDVHIDRAHEQIWQYDDSSAEVSNEAADLSTLNSNSCKAKTPRAIAAALANKYGPPTEEHVERNVALPVVLPQRRPNKRGRGFIRAYAPTLSEAGISQAMFLDIIDNLNRVLEPNPWLHAINVVGLAANAIPDPVINTLIGLALDTATDAAIEASSRSQSNTYLNYVNRDILVPRGLVAFVAVWAPDAAGDDLMAVTQFDAQAYDETASNSHLQTIRSAIAKGKTPNQVKEELQMRLKRNIRSSTGSFDWSEAAPLIFPSATENASTLRLRQNGKPKNAFDRGEVWLDGFMDKRSQAKWVEEHPEAPGATSLPPSEFTSCYADPNHAASTGDPVAFLTGGKWSLIEKQKLKDERKALEIQQKEEERMKKELKAQERKAQKEEKKMAERAIKNEQKRAKLEIESGTLTNDAANNQQKNDLHAVQSQVVDMASMYAPDVTGLAKTMSSSGNAGRLLPSVQEKAQIGTEDTREVPSSSKAVISPKVKSSEGISGLLKKVNILHVHTDQCY